MFWLTLLDSRKKRGGRGGRRALEWQTGNERKGKVMSAVSSFTVSPKVNSSAPGGEREWEGASEKDLTSHRPTFSFSVKLQWMKEDHQDDMEFIPCNSSVISVIENISFTVAVRINFRLDSNPPLPISHTWLFTWVWICTLGRSIKWPSSTCEFVMYIQINHKIPTHFIFYYAGWATINHIITGIWLHVTGAGNV